MNCRDVRLWLASRPLAADEELGAGQGHSDTDRHLAWCGDCRDEAARLRAFELRLKDRLEVWLTADEPAVPTASKARLLALLESLPVGSPAASGSPGPLMAEPVMSEPVMSQEDTSLGATSTGERAVSGPVGLPPRSPGRINRTARRMALWSVAAMLLVGLVTLLLATRPARLDRTEIELASLGQAARLQDGAARLSGAWPAALDRRLLNGAVPALVEIRGRQVEVIQFAFRRRTGVVQGRLLILPLSSLAEVPASAVFLSGGLRYVDRFAATWWVEGQFAYACCLTTAEEEAFRSLQPRRLAT
jgi:membrane protease YdiL (CAAX protease family)